MKTNYLNTIAGLIIALTIAAPVYSGPNLSGYLSNSEAESILLQKLHNARRDGDRLVLKTKSGDKVFKDGGPNKFFLSGYEQLAPENYFLVFATGQGGPSYCLINARSGQEIWVIGAPHFSPDYKRFCVMHFDGDAGVSQSLIQIYEFDGSGYTSKWEKGYGKGELAGPTEPTWINDGALLYFENTCSAEFGCGRITKVPVIVEKRETKWVGPRELK